MIQKNTLDRKNHSQTGALPHYVNPSVLSVHKRVRYLFLSFPFFPLTFFIYIYMEYRPRHGSDPPSFPRLSSRSCTSARLSKPGRPRAVPAFEPLAATRNKRNKRGRGMCVTLLYTYVHTGACKQWRAVTGGVEEERRGKSRERECRKSRIRRGWRDDDVPGNGKIIEFSKRNGEVCVRRAVDRRISFDKSRHLLPRAPSSLCPLFSFLLFLYFFE